MRKGRILIVIVLSVILLSVVGCATPAIASNPASLGQELTPTAVSLKDYTFPKLVVPKMYEIPEGAVLTQATPPAINAGPACLMSGVKRVLPGDEVVLKKVDKDTISIKYSNKNTLQLIDTSAGELSGNPVVHEWPVPSEADGMVALRFSPPLADGRVVPDYLQKVWSTVQNCVGNILVELPQ